MINLFNVDCMEFMADKPDGYYDLAIVDPPFGQTWGNIHDLASGDYKKLETLNNKASEWDIKPTKEYFKELKRVSKKYLIFGYNQLTEYLGDTNNLIVWDKCITGLKYFLRFEMIYCSFQNSDIIKVPSKKDNKQHPCQKPVELYKWLLKNYAKPNDKILDTHGGSMSIAIACHDLGFDLDLCELDKDYFEAGKNRYEKHCEQVRMF